MQVLQKAAGELTQHAHKKYPLGKYEDRAAQYDYNFTEMIICHINLNLSKTMADIGQFAVLALNAIFEIIFF